MYSDRKKLYIVSTSVFAALLLALLIPYGSGRIMAAFLLLPSAILTYVLIKKRTAVSIYSKSVLMLVSAIALLYVMAHLLSGLYFGFVNMPYGINKPNIVLKFIIPIAVIIAATELIRYILCIQMNKHAAVMAYLIGVLGDVLIESNIFGITTFAAFMSVVGLTLLPSLIYNFLYNYLSARYGFAPSLAFRAIAVWLFYLIPYGSAIPDSLISFVNLLLPMAIYAFINSLFEKKNRRALHESKKYSKIASSVISIIMAVISVGIVMLISCQFTFGLLVIATPSMTGEINQGDAIVYKQYQNGRKIEEGQILVFEKDNATTVHRVVDIEIIDGQTRYFTKGDANEDKDYGYITDADITGVVELKIPFIGQPTLWLRNLFKK